MPTAEPLYTAELPWTCGEGGDAPHLIQAIAVSLTRDREDPIVLVGLCLECGSLIEVPTTRVGRGVASAA